MIVMDLLIESIMYGLRGEQSHLHPEKIMGYLSTSKLEEYDGLDDIKRTLAHINEWMEFCLGLLDNNTPIIDFNQNIWSADTDTISLEDLKNRFLSSYKSVIDIIPHLDLHKQLSEVHNQPILKLIMTIITHNSYHLGQIVSKLKSHNLLEP